MLNSNNLKLFFILVILSYILFINIYFVLLNKLDKKIFNRIYLKKYLSTKK